MSLSKPRPILQDMPYQIKKMIVESIPSFLDRLPLHKTSKEFMGVVDTAKVNISFGIDHKTVKIRSTFPNTLTKKHTTITEAINHFKYFISKQNVTFSVMHIYGDRAFYVELVEMLTATVHRRLLVKDFRMIGGGQARILEFIEPGILENVALYWTDQVEAESVFRMEQWRQAQNVFLNYCSAACEVWWDIPSFHIYFTQSINLTDLPRVLEHISNSDTFVCGKIFEHWTINAIVEALGGDGWQWKQDRERFAEKAFPVGNRGSIVVQAFDKKVEFTMKRSDE